MKKIESQDTITLRYQTFGDKKNPAVIFSNSLGTNYRMWQPQIDAMQDDFFIIVYDTRGHGQSGDAVNADNGTDNRWTLDDLGNDVIAILDAETIDKANFCGISMGGMTGQWLGIHAGDRFNKIVVSNTAAKIGNKEAWETRSASVRENGLLELADSAPSRWFGEDFIANNADIVQGVVEQMKGGSANGYASCCEALADADMRETVKNISVDTLVIGGTHDPVTTVEDAEWLANAIGDNAKIATVNASHISNIEDEKAFTKVICEFFGE